MRKILNVSSLSFFYKNTYEALKKIEICQEEGSFSAILGRSGAGKSTLAFCLAGFLPKEGRDRMEGKILIETDMGILMEDFDAQIFCTNCELEVAFGLENKGIHPELMRKRVKEALSIVGLEGFEKRHPATLSGGQRQRLAIASVLALFPKLLLLDEPTTDLDPEGRRKLFSILFDLKKKGVSIMIFEHELDSFDEIDTLFIMDGGRIVAKDTPKSIMMQPNLLSSCGIRPPQLSFIAEAIGEPLSLDVNEAFQILHKKGYRIDEEKYKKIIEEEKVSHGPELIKMNGVYFAYEGREYVLKNIEFSLRKGEFVAIIGENGSGKTTFAKLLNGLLHPTKGVVLFYGEDTKNLPLSSICSKVGYVFQNPDSQIFAETVFEEVAFGPRNIGKKGKELQECVKEALECVGLLHLKDKDPFSLTKGERQRLALASVLAMDTEVLIMDEPTTGLDWDEQKKIMSLLLQLNKKGKTILIITHRMHFVAECAKRVLILKEGQIILDALTREAFSHEEIFFSSGLSLPEVTRLSHFFKKTILTEKEFLFCIKKDVSLHRS